MIAKQTHSAGAWTASALRKLPPEDRDAVLADAAERAELEYRTNPALTEFDAFGEDDLHGTSTATAPA